MLRRLALAALMSSLCAMGTVGVASAEAVKVGGTGSAVGLLGRLGERFAAKYPGNSLEVVPGLGSTGGIAATIDGALDLSISSRPLKPDEAAKGLTSVPLLDTPFMFVTSHPKMQNLTRAELVAIYDGALKAWPDGAEIKPVLRPKSDAATPFLTQNIEGMQTAMDKLRRRPDVPVAATDQDNIDTAEKVPHSLAGATLVQVLTEQPRLRHVSLDGVEASVETMNSGAYGLKMRLHIVAPAKPTASAQQFLSFLRSTEADQIIRESGAAIVSLP